MKELTKAEEQVMQYIWELEKGFLKDIVEKFPEPKPAYTTISTVIRVLVKKGFLNFNTYGKVHEYYPLISKSAYSKQSFRNFMSNFFNNSSKNFASFFAKDNNLTLTELEEMRALIDEEIEKQKGNDI